MNTECKPVDAHTPTPWAIGFSDGTGESYITAGDHPALKNACERVAVVVSGGTDDWGVTHGVRKPEDARRIVDCVNAMHGVTDPLALREAVDLALLFVDRRRAQDGKDTLTPAQWRDVESKLRAAIGVQS